MTPDQIQIVQETFEIVAPSADAVAALFYERLFTLDPSLRPMFTGDARAQGDKLMSTLALVVRGLRRPEQIMPAVRRLGERHVIYGVEAAHYQTVGEALLWTLAQGLGASFTEDVKSAWAAAYTMLAELMLEAAAQVPTKRAA
ncbi:MAG TPA: globin family protein [Roseiflexaceae bacterium]|nr:globin family protein [Roseiflexaceae bacterium]